MSDPTNPNANPQGATSPPGTTAPVTPRPPKRRVLIVVCVLLLLGVIGNCLVRSQPAGISSVEDYLAWAGIGGLIGLFVGEFGVLMKSLFDNDDWEVFSHTGKLFAAMWVVIVSIATATV